MARELVQVVTQDNQNGLPKRILVQYDDTESTEEFTQKIVEYDSMSVEAKAIYDTFVLYE
jgi:hypothetical protein